MDQRANGQCLCGAVKFRISGAFDSFFLCHCSRCRKDSGSAHSANLFANTATLDWLTGEDQIRIFHLPGTRHVKSFCATCGSALPYASPSGNMLVVPAGSLDTPVSLRPDAHICVSSRAGWDCDLADVAEFSGLPG
ncbi:MAG: GFA family protein [Marivita sp.]|uniref:GFA family protein n=1 Tax=Marivita sp. TaxID=2003365 RepID=UPI001B18982E|nr:GFA family protein [Marivita sp.]MBO6883381.1 GFA family protein [Marivita sp.]